MRGRALLPVTVAIAALAAATSASAGLPSSLTSSCAKQTAAPGFAYFFCDDGVPEFGGANPNPGGAQAVEVPARYQGYVGLPRKSAEATQVPGADGDGDVALDVDLSYPARSKGRLPLIFMMHGCCSGNKTGWEAQNLPAGQRFDAPGERWHYNNAWFASRGFVVVTYTSRGFRTNQGRGSTGEIRFDGRSFEINDYQSLACQVLARFNGSEALPDIDPRRVVVTGGSYGGGFSWMALTDPKWRCNKATGANKARMSLAAAAAKYGWTDLAYSLTPTGAHDQRPGHLPAFNGCASGPITLGGDECGDPGNPFGIPKRSINTGLYASGQGAVGGDRTTFPPEISEALVCTTGPYPPELNPDCESTLRQVGLAFLREASAYYQNRFFRKIRRDPTYRVPVFDAATFTDPLFTAVENRRMINRLRRVVPRYPVQAYYGDFQHFTNNKAKVWGDTCGADRHVCTFADFRRGLNANPPSLRRLGVTTRLNRFIDRFARPGANRRQRRPAFDVTAEVQVCPQTAVALGVEEDEGGPQYRARSFEALAPARLSLDLRGGQTTTSTAAPNPHAAGSDPVFSNGGKCRQETGPPGAGVASYQSEPLGRTFTMLGATRVTVDFELNGDPSSLQLDARLYDVFADGTAVLVDRGPRRLTAAEASGGAISYLLQGNGWRFARGHRVRIEIAQDDEPFLHRSDVPSSTTISRVRLSVPVRGRRGAKLSGRALARSGPAAEPPGRRIPLAALQHWFD